MRRHMLKLLPFSFPCKSIMFYLCRITFMMMSWTTFLKLAPFLSWLLPFHVRDPPKNMCNIRWWRKYETNLPQPWIKKCAFIYLFNFFPMLLFFGSKQSFCLFQLSRLRISGTWFLREDICMSVVMPKAWLEMSTEHSTPLCKNRYVHSEWFCG